MKERWLRRLPLLALLGIVAWLLLGDRPREVLLVYDLPDEPAPERVEVRIVDEAGRVPASIAWGSADLPARDRQPHRARLAPGAYRLQARLHFRDGTARDVDRDLEVDRQVEQIVLHLR